MNFLKSAFLVCTLFLCLSAGQAHAKADTVALYTEAVMTGDIPALETLLAPNYWHIAGNGHIEDKEHFIQSIKNKEMVVDRLTITNAPLNGNSRLRRKLLWRVATFAASLHSGGDTIELWARKQPITSKPMSRHDAYA